MRQIGIGTMGKLNLMMMAGGCVSLLKLVCPLATLIVIAHYGVKGGANNERKIKEPLQLYSI